MSSEKIKDFNYYYAEAQADLVRSVTFHEIVSALAAMSAHEKEITVFFVRNGEASDVGARVFSALAHYYEAESRARALRKESES